MLVMGRRLTAADVCAVTGYSRDELHALLRVLEPYCTDKPSPRVAREFAPRDLVVLAVTQILEERYGLRRTAVAELGQHLQNALAGPKGANREARLSVSVRPPKVDYLDMGAIATEGLVIALGPLFEKIDDYLSFEPQLSLQFGPSLVARKYG